MCDIGSDPSMHDLTATVPTCDANTAEIRVGPGGYGFEPVPCTQTRGLLIVEDMTGTYRRACGAAGHLADVKRRFGVADDVEEGEFLREGLPEFNGSFR